MSQEQKQYAELRFLICLSEEGRIGFEGMQKLNNILLNDPHARKYYQDYIHMNVILESLYTNERLSYEKPKEYIPEQDYTDLFSQLSLCEKNAPAIEFPENEPTRILIQKVVYPPRQKRRLSKLSRISLAINAAAVLFIVIFLSLVPPNRVLEVATLTDTVNAKWMYTGTSLKNGVRLCNDNEPFLLMEGLAELSFDNNTRVTIEGPAGFQIVDGDMIKLNYGRLYCQVPPEAYGFQICTQHSKVIDLGTEFGIIEQIDGGTEVHVLKGQVNLISNLLNKKINTNLLAGSARRIDGDTGLLEEIICEDETFVRQIDSKTNMIWRGQMTFDLADIVGGGNGFGTGSLNTGIDLDNGKIVAVDSELERYNNKSKYIPVSQSPFIDGVFVPDGSQGDVQIASNGLSYESFPDTSGSYYSPICNSHAMKMYRVASSERVDLLLENETKTGSIMSRICMHSNAGITFDLSAIRNSIPGLRIKAFKSTFGIADAAKIPESDSIDADVIILLDGESKFSRFKYNQKNDPIDIAVEIKPEDRFLTIVCTEGSRNEGDWPLFTSPVLELDEI